jgi:hypothetical protein
MTIESIIRRQAFRDDFYNNLLWLLGIPLPTMMLFLQFWH